MDEYVPADALRCPHCKYWTTGANPALYLSRHIKRRHTQIRSATSDEVRESAARMVTTHRKSLEHLAEK